MHISINNRLFSNIVCGNFNHPPRSVYRDWLSHGWVWALNGLYKGEGIIRLIPQGRVDNNLRPDRLAGPKALDPNNIRQSTLWLHDLCLEVVAVHDIELRLFGAKAFHLIILLMSRIWHSSSRYNFYRL